MASVVNSSMVSSFIGYLVSSRAFLPPKKQQRPDAQIKDKITLRRKSTKDSNRILKNLLGHCEYRGSCCYISRPPSNRRRNGRSKLQRNPSIEARWVSTQRP